MVEAYSPLGSTRWWRTANGGGSTRPNRRPGGNWSSSTGDAVARCSRHRSAARQCGLATAAHRADTFLAEGCSVAAPTWPAPTAGRERFCPVRRCAPGPWMTCPPSMRHSLLRTASWSFPRRRTWPNAGAPRRRRLRRGDAVGGRARRRGGLRRIVRDGRRAGVGPVHTSAPAGCRSGSGATAAGRGRAPQPGRWGSCACGPHRRAGEEGSGSRTGPRAGPRSTWRS